MRSEKETVTQCTRGKGGGTSVGRKYGAGGRGAGHEREQEQEQEKQVGRNVAHGASGAHARPRRDKVVPEPNGSTRGRGARTNAPDL